MLLCVKWIIPTITECAHCYKLFCVVNIWSKISCWCLQVFGHGTSTWNPVTWTSISKNSCLITRRHSRVQVRNCYFEWSLVPKVFDLTESPVVTMVTRQLGGSGVSEEGRKESRGAVRWLLNMGGPFGQKTIENCIQAVPPLSLSLTVYVLQPFSMQSQGLPGKMVKRQTSESDSRVTELWSEMTNTDENRYLFQGRTKQQLRRLPVL